MTTSTAASGAREHGRPRLLTGRYAIIYLFVLPAFVLRMLYSFIPLVQTVWLSLTNRSLVNPGAFVGLQNYQFALTRDKTLINSLGYTVAYTAASTILETVLGLGIAILMMQRLRGRSFSNFVMLLPWVMAPLLAGVVWRVIYWEQSGLLNFMLLEAGLVDELVRWLSDPAMARVSVIVLTVWKNVSWVALIFMAALGSLSKEVLEAAAVDGANALQRFWFVTLPLLRPSIYLVLMLRGMAEVQTFEQILGLTQGGPGNATRTLALYSYQRFFVELRYGYGSAINVLLLLLTVAIGGVFAWLLYRSGTRVAR